MPAVGADNCEPSRQSRHAARETRANRIDEDTVESTASLEEKAAVPGGRQGQCEADPVREALRSLPAIERRTQPAVRRYHDRDTLRELMRPRPVRNPLR